MREFFVGIPNRLELFGGLHIAVSAVFVALAALLFAFSGKLARFGHFTAIRRTMALILTMNMIIHYSTRIIYGIWSIEADLPLHICFVTNFFMIYILLSDNKGDLYRIIYFFTFIGPLPAMIWPDLDYSWQSFMFWQFVISHHFMLLCSLYCLTVLRYRTEFKAIIPTFVIGNLYIGAVTLLNKAIGTNYIMMTSLPEQLYEVYPFLDKLPPVVWLEAVGILAMLAAYIPAAILNHDRKGMV